MPREPLLGIWIATAADRHCHFSASVGGVNTTAVLASGKTIPDPAVPAAPPVYGTKFSVPLPARAVVVTVMTPVAGTITTEVKFGDAVGLPKPAFKTGLWCSK